MQQTVRPIKKFDETGEENAQAISLFTSPEFDKFRLVISQADVQLSSLIAQAQQFSNLKFFQLPYRYGKIEGRFQILSFVHFNFFLSKIHFES